jgi:thiol-disulfide isomerase/thioredoxin
MIIKTLILLFSSLLACTPELEVSDSSTEEVEVALGVHASSTCSQIPGQSICNLALKDQDDKVWQLHSLKGNVVLLDFSAMWCSPCQSAATTVQKTQDDYESEGFSYITVLVDDPDGATIELDDVQAWVNSYGINTATVLQGNRDLIDYNAVKGYPLASWPTFVFVDRDMNIYYGMYGFNEEFIRSKIEEML